MSLPMLEKSTIMVNVLNVADIVLTWVSINFCNAVEANPIALSMFGIVGYIPFLLLKMFFIFGITLLFNHYSRGSIYQKTFEAVLIVSFGFVTISNFLVIMEGAIL
jgi:FlaA1/EpsC-like NDP-sugar epimerase